MIRPVTVMAVVLAAAVLSTSATATTGAESYIVVLKDRSVSSGAVASEHSRKHGAGAKHVYGHALAGYAAAIPSNRVAAVRADSRVAYGGRDGVASAWRRRCHGASTGSTQIWAARSPATARAPQRTAT